MKRNEEKSIRRPGETPAKSSQFREVSPESASFGGGAYAVIAGPDSPRSTSSRPKSDDSHGRSAAGPGSWSRYIDSRLKQFGTR